LANLDNVDQIQPRNNRGAFSNADDATTQISSRGGPAPSNYGTIS